MMICRSPSGSIGAPKWCRSLLAVVVALGCLAIARTVAGGTDTGQLSVTAIVLSGCTLSGGTLDFGTYVSGQSQMLVATGAIGYTNCFGLLTFELDGGQSGDVTQREMRAGASSLRYQLFRDSARSRVWGSGSDALLVEAAPTQHGSVPVYGWIPGGQSLPAGIYADIVNITLTF